jgi:hypothetical protein
LLLMMWWWLRLVEENICSESILLAKGVRTWDSMFLHT